MKVLAPPRVEPPVFEAGMRVGVAPWPHVLFMRDFEYYDQLGRDPFQQHKIWLISDPTERVGKMKNLLEEYPKQKHRRKMLFQATVRGDEAIVRCLVESGVRIQPVMRQAQDENETLERGDDIADEGRPEEDDLSLVPLHAAAHHGRLGCVRIFVDSGADVDARDEIGRTPLIASANAAHPQVVKYLLSLGADPSARMANNDLAKDLQGPYAGANAMEMAAARGNVQILQMLFDHRMLEPSEGQEHRTDEDKGVEVTPLALRSAAGGGFEAFKLLLDRGGYSTEVQDGKTKVGPLSETKKQALIDATPLAAQFGDLESLKLVLNYQYPTDREGSLLPFEHSEELQRLFVYGAYQSMERNNPAKFEFLYSLGLKEHDAISLDKLPEGQSINIQHLLDKAVQAGSIDCVRMLVQKYGADPHRHRLPPGIQPLYQAAANNRSEMVQYLLENHKPDIHLGNGRFAAGPTALWIAIWLKSLDSISLLLQHGGPVDHIDDEIPTISQPATAILRVVYGDRPAVRFEIGTNAQKHIESVQGNCQNINRDFVLIEIGPDDRSWITNLQFRKPDKELREEGDKARELNGKEGAETKDLVPTELRRLLAPYPTVSWREDELGEDKDLLPQWQPCAVPATHYGSGV